MTKNILSLLITVLLFSCSGNNGKNDAEQMLTSFYTQYIAEQSKPRPDEKVISALYEKFLTAELRQKLEQADLEYSPFLGAQECDKDWEKTLVITHSEEDVSKYGVSFSFLADVDKYGVETRRYIWLSLVKENGGYLIYEIQGLSEEAAETAEFDYDKFTAKSAYDFVPQNYEVLQILEEEGIDFCFLLIRVINPDAIIQRDERGTLGNFNRRGIIIAEYVGENYQLIVRNEDFFESDSECGDGYFAPELNMEISDRNLIFAYTHDKEGSWRYTFRYRNNGFYLIGYDNYIGAMVYTNTEYSINFLTKRMKITTYFHEEGKSEDGEVDIKVDNLYKLTSDGNIEGLSEYVRKFIETEK